MKAPVTMIRSEDETESLAHSANTEQDALHSVSISNIRAFIGKCNDAPYDVIHQMVGVEHIFS